MIGRANHNFFMHNFIKLMRIKGNGCAIWGFLYTGNDQVSYSETETKTGWDHVKVLCEASLLQHF